MKRYKYGWNSFLASELEKSLNDLGAAGWRVVYLEWDENIEKYLCLVEKSEE